MQHTMQHEFCPVIMCTPLATRLKVAAKPTKRGKGNNENTETEPCTPLATSVQVTADSKKRGKGNNITPESETLSLYEEERLATIEKNTAEMNRLGLGTGEKEKQRKAGSGTNLAVCSGKGGKGNAGVSKR